jgi:multidrug efflux pump subunit AcrA (membrane-fusion protein)
MPAFWVKDDTEYPRAKALLDRYQEARQLRVRAEYEALKREGKQRTIVDEIREKPLRFLITIAFIGFLLYITLYPFIHFLSGSDH